MEHHEYAQFLILFIYCLFSLRFSVPVYRGNFECVRFKDGPVNMYIRKNYKENRSDHPKFVKLNGLGGGGSRFIEYSI